MYSLSVENQSGQILNLTENPNYITIADGFNAITANVNTTASAVGHGTTFNSAKIGNRNITLQIILKGDIEASRIVLYPFFTPSSQITLYYQNEHRKVYTSGYVESFECDPNQMVETANVSIICNNPFLLDDEVKSQSLMHHDSYFSFPFAVPEEGVAFGHSKFSADTIIVNEGEHEVGVVFKLYAKSNLTAPIKITNLLTGDFFAIDISMEIDDVIIIDTRDGQKSVVLLRNDTVTNILDDVVDGSTWLKLYAGKNLLTSSTQETATGTTVYDSLLKVDIEIIPEFIGA